MKKVISAVLVLILVFGLSFAALAVEVTSCNITAENVTASAGSSVTVPVKISSNLGFTNFAIALDYDRDYLELVSITPADECGSLVSVNTAWDPSKDDNAKNNAAFTAGSTYGYVVCASDEAITGDGELFSANFKVSTSFTGSAAVTPIVSYIRNNGAVFSVFEELSANASSGAVTKSDVLLGDVDGNGSVTVKDALSIYQIFTGKITATEAQKIAADVDCNGSVTVKDALAAYKIYKGV